ncbi:MAG: hypothetical protein KF878_00225 [Planctomycetes bacterium]|nr:hypothetical protein [Planctomycetota bacterium]
MADRPPILALDLATRTGWAYLAPGAERPESGAVDLADHGPAARVVALELWLWPRLAPLAAGRGLIVYETPGLVLNRAAPFRVGCHLESAVLRLARAWQVDHLLGVAPAELKKHATNMGNASKDEVTRAMRVRWGRTEAGELALVDDNESDALALLSCALKALEDGLELAPAAEDAA